MEFFSQGCKSLKVKQLRKTPAENGKKASLLRNWPSESKKCSGLKTSGVAHSSLSNSTVASMVVIGVPLKMINEILICEL